MIDPECSSMSHNLLDAGAEQPVSVHVIRNCVWRWESPVLAIGRESIGRRSNAATIYVEAPMRPQVRAATVRRQCQIMVKTDAHAATFGVPLGFGELLVDDKLNV